MGNTSCELVAISSCNICDDIRINKLNLMWVLRFLILEVENVMNGEFVCCSVIGGQAAGGH